MILSEVFIGSDRISQRVKELASEISASYTASVSVSGTPLVIGVLSGAFVFTADLIRAMTIRCDVDFMAVDSYGSAMESCGTLKFRLFPKSDLRGRDIIIAEDILDTGHTLNGICEYLREHGVNSIKAAVLLDKPERRQVPFEADFVGFTIPDKFVVGYGLDYDERYRNLPDIHCLEDERDINRV
ncbi:MAG: hypoxanthine phosphoribosyltransferase [Oscillospiraceae bacterium]|jgi:hypoxanthine phosphoribosyltransferase|nr:hypoxanthine phosphoribosyltransferase [Oscillospiraceae bacterium]